MVLSILRLWFFNTSGSSTIVVEICTFLESTWFIALKEYGLVWAGKYVYIRLFFIGVKSSIKLLSKFNSFKLVRFDKFDILLILFFLRYRIVRLDKFAKCDRFSILFSLALNKFKVFFVETGDISDILFLSNLKDNKLGIELIGVIVLILLPEKLRYCHC